MVELPQFDRLVSGDDYNRPDAPTTDALDTGAISSSQHVRDSTNDAMDTTPVSIASSSQDAPPTGAFLGTNLHERNWLDPMKPHVSPEPQSPKI